MMPSSCAIASAVAGMLLSAASMTSALRVVAPSEGMTVVAERPYEVKWTGASEDTRFDIDLHYCGSYSFCFEDDCGFFIASLCREGEAGCVQEEGGYDVTMPEPLAFVSGDGYKLRISEVGSGRVECSDDFYLMSTEDSLLPGEPGPATIDVLSPTKEDVAVAGEEYTVEFDYDNGFGERLGRFKFDLYSQDGDGQWQGDCGGWVASVCDTPDAGCKDSQGDYNVIIPKSAEGSYKIRVGLFGDDSVFACSEPFEVKASGETLWL